MQCLVSKEIYFHSFSPVLSHILPYSLCQPENVQTDLTYRNGISIDLLFLQASVIEMFETFASQIDMATLFNLHNSICLDATSRGIFNTLKFAFEHIPGSVSYIIDSYLVTRCSQPYRVMYSAESIKDLRGHPTCLKTETLYPSAKISRKYCAPQSAVRPRRRTFGGPISARDQLSLPIPSIATFVSQYPVLRIFPAPQNSSSWSWIQTTGFRRLCRHRQVSGWAWMTVLMSISSRDWKKRLVLLLLFARLKTM